MIYAANFKTNHTRGSTKEYIASLNTLIKDTSHQIFVFPPATALDSYDSIATIGAQNAHFTQNGAFTGEIGLEQLDEFGIKTILIGHSERRHKLGESQKNIALKYNYYKALGYKIMYCIGEPLEVKKLGLTKTLEYIWEQFEGIDLDYENLILAYEPVWAIGTGLTASSEKINEMHSFIRKILTKLFVWVIASPWAQTQLTH